MKKTTVLLAILLSVLFCAQAAFGQTPRTAEDYNVRGNSYYNKADYTNAIADFTQALKMEPNNAVFFANRAEAYFAAGDYNKSLADANQALKIQPDKTSASCTRGKA